MGLKPIRNVCKQAIRGRKPRVYPVVIMKRMANHSVIPTKIELNKAFIVPKTKTVVATNQVT